MKKKSSSLELKDQALKLADQVFEAAASCYGIIGFVSGPLYKGKIGSRVANIKNGGLCLRLYPDGSVELTMHVILCYKVRALSSLLSVRQTIGYLLRRRGYKLIHMDIFAEGVKSAA